MIEPWVQEGKCHGRSDLNHLFFPATEKQAEKGKAFCLGCPVREQCLEYGLANHEIGIYGGLTEKERRDLSRKINRQMKKLIPIPERKSA